MNKSLNNYSFLLWWASLTSVSISFSVFIGTSLHTIVLPPIIPSVEGLNIFFVQRAIFDGVAIGLISGSFQWLVLRKFDLKWKWWIFVSVLGWAFGIPLATHFYLKFLDKSFILLGGAVIGFFQWLVLRQYFQKAYWWIVASAICYLFIIAPLPLGDGLPIAVGNFIYFLILGILSGISTGSLLLFWLINDSQNKA